MSRTISAFSIVFLFTVASAVAQDPDLQDLRIDVAYLSSDLLEGRGTGSPGATLAADYIQSRFEDIGLKPAGTEGWFQPFSFVIHPNPHDSSMKVELQGKNVIGLLDRGSDRHVVVGAHFDHLGYGGPGSRAPGDSAIHNGADDNASGVAAMLEIADRLARSDDLSQNVLFLAFSGEEHGLHGSKHFVNHPTVELGSINYMLNLDMVGRLQPNRSLVVGGAGTSPTWIPLLDSLGAGQFHIKVDSSGLGPSDHASFYLKERPVLHFFTGQHEDYHKPNDDSQYINYEGIQDISDLAARLVHALDTQPALAFNKTRDEQRDRNMRFKVSLGIMPDYTFQGKGLRIDAVLDERTAARAGLQDGDIVVRIGETDIDNIYAYMEALGKYEAGDETVVIVEREGQAVETRVVW
jgi:hypothetical protein